MSDADPIVIVPYDPTWPESFETEATRLRNALGALAIRIDHVGSTAVPGLDAKPVIDIQISMGSLFPMAGWGTTLEQIGYRHFPDPEFPEYPFFCRPHDWPHTHHVHVCETGSFHERRHLAFRDALRADADLMRRYAELKYRLAAEHSAATHAARNAYSKAKTAFIEAVQPRA